MNFSPFHFKRFSVLQKEVAHAVGTDGVLLGAWADLSDAHTILDIGTGTGLIALMLAQRTEADVRLTAIDVHAGSVACARRNFNNSPWKERLWVEKTSAQQFAAACTSSFDLIVSNPPFFSETTVSPVAERRLGRYAGSLTIDDLLNVVARMLTPTGKCCIILPAKEGKHLCELAVPMGLYCSLEVQVRGRAGKPVERLLLQLERNPGRFRREELAIYGEAGQYSPEFAELVEGFYLGAGAASGK